MKKRHRPHRLGSFEQLESRALLAHAGLMMREMDNQPPADFSRAARDEMRMESHSRDFATMSVHGPRESFYNDQPLEPISAPPTYQVPATIVFVPTTPVVVIITFPVSPVLSPPTFANSAASAAADNGAQSSFVSSLSSPASDRASNYSTPVSAPAIVDRPSTSVSHRGSLSVLTGLAIGLVATRDVDAEETAETTTPTASEHDDGEKLDEDSQLAAREMNPAATNPERHDSDEEDLIELDQEELRKRVKRKAAPPVAASDVRTDRRASGRQPDVLRATDLPRAELSHVEVEVVLQPISDDLIELLTNDQIAPEATAGSSATPFAAVALQLEANLGYHQAVEVAYETAPAPEVPAAVAAAALPAREAQ